MTRATSLAAFGCALLHCDAHASLRQLGEGWDYLHPQSWEESYPNCGGLSQSPVNIETDEITITGNMSSFDSYVHMNLTTMSVENTGHGLQVTGDAAGEIGTTTLSGETYDVLQFHLHFPSEHAVDGELTAGELHIVHQKRGSVGLNDLLVIGIMYELGAENDFLAQMGLPYGAPASPTSEPIVLGSNLGEEFAEVFSGGFYRYDGSLTTPPCDETVSWFVMEKMLHVSQAQVDAFNNIYGDPANNRPLQLLNGREIVKNSATSHESNLTDSGCPSHDGDERRLAGSSFDYLFPQCWGEWYPECNGDMQSPINIETFGHTSQGNLLRREYSAWSGMLLTNTGHTLKLAPSDAEDHPFHAGNVQWGEGSYNVLQAHLHFPSEHAFDGELLAGELHIVHQMSGSSGYDDLLVVGVPFKVGVWESTFLKHIGLPVGAPADASSEALEIPGWLDMDETLGVSLTGDFMTYSGSLTTPPCSETVRWIVMTTPVECSQAQVDAFKDLFPNPSNSRPLQPIGDREVLKNYDSGDDALTFVGAAECRSWSFGSMAIMIAAIVPRILDF